VDGRHLGGELAQDAAVVAEVALAHERLAGHLQEDAPVTVLPPRFFGLAHPVRLALPRRDGEAAAAR
jgi:hypothetical protein